MLADVLAKVEPMRLAAPIDGLPHLLVVIAPPLYGSTTYCNTVDVNGLAIDGGALRRRGRRADQLLARCQTSGCFLEYNDYVHSGVVGALSKLSGCVLMLPEHPARLGLDLSGYNVGLVGASPLDNSQLRVRSNGDLVKYGLAVASNRVHINSLINKEYPSMSMDMLFVYLNSASAKYGHRTVPVLPGLRLVSTDCYGRLVFRGQSLLHAALSKRKMLTKPAAASSGCEWLWLIDAHEDVTIDADTAEALHRLSELKAIPSSILCKVYKTCFSDIVPGHVWRYGVSEKARWVWSGVRDLASDIARNVRRRARLGLSVVYNERVSVCRGITDTQSKAVDEFMGVPGYGSRLATEPGLWADIASKAASLGGPGCNKVLRILFPCTSQQLTIRETYDVGVVFASLREKDKAFAALLAKRALGLGGQCVARLGLYYLSGATGKALVSSMIRHGWLDYGLEEFEQLGKAVHAVVRSSGALDILPLGVTVTDADSAMYMQLLSGRYDFHDLDVSGELVDRMKPNPTKVINTKSGPSELLFKTLVDQSLGQDRRRAAHVMHRHGQEKLMDLLAYYGKYSATGSCKSLRGKLSVMWEGREHDVDSPSKVAWLANLDEQQVIEVVADVGSGIETTGVRKTESGKLRMLLPAPEAHWLAETLAIMDSERAVFGPVRQVALEKTKFETLHGLLQRLSWVKSGLTVAAEDFEDFNILQDYESMRADYIALASEIASVCGLHDVSTRMSKDMSLPAIAAASCLILASAFDSMRARDVADHSKWYQLVRGLWSGWRSTMWFNTRYNKAYTHAVQRGVEVEYGFPELKDYYIVGDDSLLATTSEFEGLRRLEAYDRSNLASQAIKQMVDDGQAELTRIMHRADGSVKGSLVRAICNGASNDMQGSRVVPGPHMAQSLKTQIHMWVRRGFDYSAAERLLNVAVKYWVKLRVRRHDSDSASNVAIPDAIIRGSVQTGGLGVTMPGVLPPDLKLPVVLGKSKVRDEIVRAVGKQWQMRNLHVAAHMTQQRFAGHGLTIDNDTILNALRGGVYGSNTPTMLSMLADQADHGEWELAINDWLERGGSRLGYLEVKAAPRELAKAVEAGMERVGRVYKELSHCAEVPSDLVRWTSPWSNASALAAIALGPSAGAPGALDTVRRQGKKVSRAEVANILCGRSRALADLHMQVGSMANQFIEGKVSKPLSVGLVSPAHYVLVDLALTEVVGYLRHEMEGSKLMFDLTNTAGARMLSQACALIERKIVADPVLGLQQAF
jgi:hypothetical protein